MSKQTHIEPLLGINDNVSTEAKIQNPEESKYTSPNKILIDQENIVMHEGGVEMNENENLILKSFDGPSLDMNLEFNLDISSLEGPKMK